MYIVLENNKIQNSEDWLKERNKHIGGSECAAIIGVSPYMTNIDLFNLKTGRKQPKDISEKSYVKYGTEAEEPIRHLYAIKHPELNVYYKPYDIRISKKYEFISASLDSEIEEIETKKRGIYEGKTASIQNNEELRKWLSGNIPQNYFCQLLHNMYVIDADFAVINAELLPSWYENESIFKSFRIERAEVQESIDYLINAEVEFWTKYVEKKKCPPLKLPPL